MVTMGLDLSMTGTGLVMLRGGTRILTHRHYETKPINQLPKRADSNLWHGVFYGQEDERIEWITRRCMLGWHHFHPELVMIEGYAFGAKGSALSALHELGGVMKNKLLVEEAVYVVKTPAEVKQYATGNGRASKDEMWAAALLELWPECPNDDEADALWMAKWSHDDYANFVETA